MTKRILVCGSRTWHRAWLVDVVLDGLAASRDIEVISGMARGADTHAAEWARARGVTLHEFPADWERHGKAAGFVRNRQMLDEGRPDLVVAFTDDLPASRGTAMMVALARTAGVATVVVGGSDRS